LEVNGLIKFNNNQALGYVTRGMISSNNPNSPDLITKPQCPTGTIPKIRTYLTNIWGTGNVNADDVLGVWCISHDEKKWKCVVGDCDCCSINGDHSLKEDGTINSWPSVWCGFGGGRAIYETYCGYPNSSSPYDLVNGKHSSEQCMYSGGTVVTDNGGNKFCKYNMASCPSGWFQYGNWSTTASKTCTAPNEGRYYGMCARGLCVFVHKECEGVKKECRTGSHEWSKNNIETCTYGGKCYNLAGEYVCCQKWTCSADITHIGCY
jgi:hypothetical protein